MVKLMFEGFCKGCPYADLELLDYLQVDGKTFWQVRCRHDVICKASYDKAKNGADMGVQDAE